MNVTHCDNCRRPIQGLEPIYEPRLSGMYYCSVECVPEHNKSSVLSARIECPEHNEPAWYAQSLRGFHCIPVLKGSDHLIPAVRCKEHGLTVAPSYICPKCQEDRPRGWEDF